MMPAPQHIVIVDDSALNLRMYATMLSSLPNVKIHRFSSSRAALDWTAANDADCFVIDIHMPAPNGIELARLLRQNPRTWLTPIVIVTVDPDRDVRYAALDAGVNDFVQTPVDPREFQSRVGTFLELHAARKRLDQHVGDLSVSLRDEEQRSREHAARLEVLWRVATNPAFDNDEMLSAVLTQSAAAVRPGEPFVARLFRLDGDEAVLEAACESPIVSAIGVLPVGTRISLAGSNVGMARERGKALAWDDVQHEAALTSYHRLAELGIRSQIIAPLRAAGVDYALTYISPERSKRSFGVDDITYATIVAAFLQALYQQRWQSERIQYQMQTDALTGLMNRARFRALTRQASLAARGCAIAIADVIGFSAVNARFGNLIGDALLVEVAAALAATATGDEFVGRLGGDAFGIALPGALTEAGVRERLAPYLRIFEQPFSTGDRNGVEFVPLGVRIGCAVGHPDLSFNDLLARADLAVKGSHHLIFPNIAVYDDVEHGPIWHVS